MRELYQFAGVDDDACTRVHAVERHVVAIFKFIAVVMVFIDSELFLRVTCDLTINVELIFNVVDVLHTSNFLDHTA